VRRAEKVYCVAISLYENFEKASSAPPDFNYASLYYYVIGSYYASMRSWGPRSSTCDNCAGIA